MADAVSRAWADLPALLQAHPGVKALYRAALAAQQAPQAEPVAWECKAGGLKPLTDAQYRKQRANIQRHYTRIAPPAAPAGWHVRDRSDLEPGALDLTGPAVERVVLLPGHRDPHSRTLYALAAAMLAAAPTHTRDAHA